MAVMVSYCWYLGVLELMASKSLYKYLCILYPHITFRRNKWGLITLSSSYGRLFLYLLLLV